MHGNGHVLYPTLPPSFRTPTPHPTQDHTSAPVIAKYDQLTRGTQQLVQAAAVIGQEVNYVCLGCVVVPLLPTVGRGVEGRGSGMRCDVIPLACVEKQWEFLRLLAWCGLVSEPPVLAEPEPSAVPAVLPLGENKNVLSYPPASPRNNYFVGR